MSFDGPSGRISRRHCLAAAVVSLHQMAIAAAADAPVSFTTDIVPILKTHCAVCHLTGDEAGRLSLTPARAYSSIAGVPSIESKYFRVQPGDPDNSYLLMKLEGTHLDHGGRGSRMPYGAEPLGTAELATIRRWIASGAKNN